MLFGMQSLAFRRKYDNMAELIKSSMLKNRNKANSKRLKFCPVYLDGTTKMESIRPVFVHLNDIKQQWQIMGAENE